MNKKYLTIFVVILTAHLLGFCKNSNEANSNITNSNASKPKNLVSIVEIPVSDLKRATQFYQKLLDVKIEEISMDGVQMGIFPTEEGAVNVTLSKGADYKPTSSGSILYFNCGEDLNGVLEKVEPNGGKIILRKTPISPEMGFFALFTDTEGNKLGLHSQK